MSCNHGSLLYTSPAHGGWGVVRLAMLVPESYQLFVCPFACGRHGALGAIGHGIKDRLSYLYIEESDIVSGSYEKLIPEAVTELLETLEQRPKVLLIFVSCLDDLLGTDHEAILAILHRQHPEVQFTFCHMNPITQDGDNPPPVNIRRKMYGLLKAGQKRNNQVNIIGNPVPVAPSSEVFGLLQELGIQRVNHISQFTTMSEFQEMAGARLNLVLAPPGKRAAEDLREQCQIPFELAFANYREEEVIRQYQHLLVCLSGGRDIVFDFAPYRERARRAVRQALVAAGNRPVYLDYTATAHPYGAARALLEAGFHVAGIFSPKVLPADQEHARWLKIHAPELQILDSQAPGTPGLIGEFPAESIAIGLEAGYITRSSHVVGLVNDEGNFGFDGIVRLMEGITGAVSKKNDKEAESLETMIKNYGLVI